MIGAVDITDFADKVAGSNIVTNNLLKVGYEDAAAAAMSKRRNFDPQEFKGLLEQKHFLAARSWLRYDPDEFQKSIVDNIDYIFENLFTPELVIMGLFLFKKLHKRNRTFEIKQKFLAIAVEFLDQLPLCHNPILIAILFAEVLTGQRRAMYIETAVRIENGLNERSGTDHLMQVYYDKDLDGRWLISIIHQIEAVDMITTEGVKNLIYRDWNGPYKCQLIPRDHSSIWYCI